MISILMPLYNGIEFIEESISSVLNQTFTEWELLIGINGHPENSDVYKTAKSYEEKSNKIRVFDFFEIKNKPKTLNELIKYCSFDYIALLDVDDVWFPEKLQIQKEYITKYDVVGISTIYIVNGLDENLITIPLGDISDSFCFFENNPIINSSCIIKKSLCLWKEDCLLEDYDLLLTLRKKGKLFYNISEILTKHRLHENSFFNKRDLKEYKNNLVNLYLVNLSSMDE